MPTGPIARLFSIVALQARKWRLGMLTAKRPADEQEQHRRFAMDTLIADEWELNPTTHTAVRFLSRDRIFGYGALRLSGLTSFSGAGAAWRARRGAKHAGFMPGGVPED